MSILYEERSSDSPYIETVTRGRTICDGSPIRPAECHWHMVISRQRDRVQPIVVGPLTESGVVSYTGGAEILWIKFKLGVFMPHLTARHSLDVETILPEATSQSFWLNSSAWRYPDYDNAETFVARLVRDGVLVRDPVVSAVLHEEPGGIPSRTVRDRFLRATGLTQCAIRQMQRAQRAATLLQQGVSILDTVHDAGYFDQPHLTRSLRRFIGHTPTQLVRMCTPICHSVQDRDCLPDYHTDEVE